jgi:dTDP-4-amino-4,6-dideoxygalactose transaminase
MPVKFLDLGSEIKEIEDGVHQAIKRTIDTSSFILGEQVGQFEKEFSEYIGTKYCVGVGNGTDALEIALQVLNMEPGEEVLTQANTFVSTCFGVTHNDLKINLIDVDEKTYQLDLDLLEEKITEKTRAVIVVHLTGSCCDMERLLEIVDRHKLVLIEDTSQAHGATFKGRKLGSFGLLSTFSFYPGKNLGAFGDGGAICTSDDGLALGIRKIRNLGSVRKYEHELIGRNSRLDTLQAGILSVKLSKLDGNNLKRRRNASLYSQLLKTVRGIELPVVEPGCQPVYHLYMIRTDRRDALKSHLEKHGIETGIHYPISISQLPCYRGVFDQDEYPVSTSLSERILSLPMYPNLPKESIEEICGHIQNFFVNLDPN